MSFVFPMDRCPVEICNEIFRLACSDNGYTGRSLSLVSKFVRETSQASKLQSLSVIGYEQLIGLASALDNIHPTLRQVRYIFISAHARRTAFDPKALAPEYTRRESAYAAFARILRAISPTVEILHAFFIFYRQFPLLPVSLPLLHELTLHGPLEVREAAPDTQSIQFPSLRHLHLTSFYSPTHLFQQILKLAPSLLHLRISAPEHSETFVSELQMTLETSNANEMLPSGLDKIFVHCPIEPKDNWMNMMSLYEQTMQDLTRLAREHERLILLSPLRIGLFRTVSIQDAEVAWMDSIEGRTWW